MQIGVDSFVEISLEPGQPLAARSAARMREVLEEIELADQVGLDVFGIGEHHRPEFLASAPAAILAAAAAKTKRIRLASAVTVLSSDDPVRVFQDFATLDLISEGRAEIIVGRGSFIESYPLFGVDLDLYDEVFVEKLDLLLKLREKTQINWTGAHRPTLTGQGVYPRPVQQPLPVRIGVGGTPASFVRAGRMGLPLVVAIIGGEPHRFRPLIDNYRAAGKKSGHAPEKLEVAIHSIGHLADTTGRAAEEFFPHYAAAFTRIGLERGWPPVTREQFDAARAPMSALVVGEPELTVEKILYENEALGGISRLSILFGAGAMPHTQVMKAIELLGTKVAPAVRKALGVNPA